MRKQDFTPGLNQVKVAGLFTKNKQEAVQPVPSFLRSLLTTYAMNLREDDFLFPGGWRWRPDVGRWETDGWVRGKSAGAFLRFDAAKGGIVIGREGKDQNGGVLDFHSLRHFFGAACDRAGISDGLRCKLHRASKQKLLDRYTHRELAELTAAVEELPAIAWGG